MDRKLLEAIDKRRSVRSYINKSVDKESIEKINGIINKLNKEDSFRFELIIDSPKAFSSFRKSYGTFKGVNSYISLVINEKDPDAMEKIGYYGEQLLLEAVKMNLGTCWVFATFDKDSVITKLNSGEKLIGVITIGYHNESFSFGEKLSYSLVGARKVKPLDYYYSSEEELPDWFLGGVSALSKAPSAINTRPVVMTFKDGITTATLGRKSKAPQTDLGIAKFHFVSGAGGGCFSWGENGCYSKT